MKRTLLSLTFLLAVAVAALALAAAPAADTPATADPTADAATPPMDTPEPLFLDGCTANLYCDNGSYIQCSGSSNCVVGGDYVECDGNRVNCPAQCVAPQGCGGHEAEYCSCVAGGGAPLPCKRCACFDLCGPPGSW